MLGKVIIEYPLTPVPRIPLTCGTCGYEKEGGDPQAAGSQLEPPVEKRGEGGKDRIKGLENPGFDH